MALPFNFKLQKIVDIISIGVDIHDIKLFYIGIFLRGEWSSDYHVFVLVSLCSFICLQAVYQLSRPVCKSTWRYMSFLHASYLHFMYCD